MADSWKMSGKLEGCLEFDHFEIVSFLGDELGVGAGLEDLAVLEQENLVRGFHGLEAVRDDHDCASRKKFFESLGDSVLGDGVERRGWFVEEKNFGVFEEKFGDGEALALTARQFDAAFADFGVDALREISDKICVGEFEDFLEFLGGGLCGEGVGQIFAN